MQTAMYSMMGIIGLLVYALSIGGMYMYYHTKIKNYEGSPKLKSKVKQLTEFLAQDKRLIGDLNAHISKLERKLEGYGGNKDRVTHLLKQLEKGSDTNSMLRRENERLERNAEFLRKSLDERNQVDHFTENFKAEMERATGIGMANTKMVLLSEHQMQLILDLLPVHRKALKMKVLERESHIDSLAELVKLEKIKQSVDRQQAELVNRLGKNIPTQKELEHRAELTRRAKYKQISDSEAYDKYRY